MVYLFQKVEQDEWIWDLYDVKAGNIQPCYKVLIFPISYSPNATHTWFDTLFTWHYYVFKSTAHEGLPYVMLFATSTSQMRVASVYLAVDIGQPGHSVVISLAWHVTTDLRRVVATHCRALPPAFFFFTSFCFAAFLRPNVLLCMTTFTLWPWTSDTQALSQPIIA